MQRTIKYTLAATILSVFAGAVSVEQNDTTKLSCEEQKELVISKMSGRCRTTECQDIADRLEEYLTDACVEIDELYVVLKGLLDEKDEVICIAKCEVRNGSDCLAECGADSSIF